MDHPSELQRIELGPWGETPAVPADLVEAADVPGGSFGKLCQETSYPRSSHTSGRHCFCGETNFCKHIYISFLFQDPDTKHDSFCHQIGVHSDCRSVSAVV